MGGIVDAITGGGQKRQAAAMADAAARQQAELTRQEKLMGEERARLGEIEAGQKRLRNASGGRGMLAYVSDELLQTFGGRR